MSTNESSNNLLYTKSQIADRVKELAQQLSKDYQGKHILMVGILKGSFVLMADLVRALYNEGLRMLKLIS